MSSSHLTNAATQGLQRRLEADRQRLLDSGVYLGETNHSFLDDATWKRIGRGYQLVTKESVEEAQTAANSAESDPDFGKKSDDVADGTLSELGEADTDPNSLLKQAVFSVVVQISYDDCWLTPCGHWKGPTQVTKNFEDLKLTFQGVRPGHEVFSQDFTTAIKNIRQLVNAQITTVGSSSSNTALHSFLTNSRANNGDALKFRHVLFEKVDPNESDSDSTVSDTEEIYTLAGWPIIHPEADEKRHEMLRSNTHRIVPLPAYDIKGNLIRPDKYKEALAGALVRINFTMSHWFIASRNQSATNTFVADVTSIRVLTDPIIPKSPTKRRTARHEPEIASPSRRRRTDGLA